MMYTQNKKVSNSAMGGLAWTFLERILAQLVSTIVGIILARILLPSEYGVVSIVMVLINLCNVFVTSGFGTALVQKKECQKLDFDTAFIMSFIMSALIYLVLFLFSDTIAAFYNMHILSPVIKVLGVRIIITALNNVQHSYIQREMQFRKFFFSTLAGTLLSCFVGVIMAYCGLGVWALVAQYMTNTIIDTIILWIVCGWTPSFKFSKECAKSIMGFGWKVLATNMISQLNYQIKSLLVGKVFGASDLAFYDQGQKYPNLIITNINSSIQKVMLPVYSKKQENLKSLLATLRKSIRIGLYVIAPVLIGFFSISDSFVKLILTEKWNAAIPFIQIFCLMYLTRPLESSCHQALLAIGKSGLCLRLMVLIDGSGLILALISIFYFKSIIVLAISSLVTTLISITVFLFATNKYLNYTKKQQISDIAPTLLMVIAMGGIVMLLDRFLNVSIGLKLFIEILIGLLSYIGLSIVTKSLPYIELIQTINFLRGKNK